MNWFTSFWKALTTPMGSAESSAPVSATRSEAATGKRGPRETRTQLLGNFTPRCQSALALARLEAHRLHHYFVGTEHVLLGLIRLGEGTAVDILRKLGLDLETVRLEIEKQLPTGPAESNVSGEMTFTPRVKKVLTLAAGEAKSLGHLNLGTEHLLMGLFREGDGVAPRILESLGVTVEQVRGQISTQPESVPPLGRGISASPEPMPMNVSPAQTATVDASKRFDVYCSEFGDGTVVYRNAIFKGTTQLRAVPQAETGLSFVVLEQANGHTIYLSPHAVVKFCEHGSEIHHENVKPS